VDLCGRKLKSGRPSGENGPRHEVGGRVLKRTSKIPGGGGGTFQVLTPHQPPHPPTTPHTGEGVCWVFGCYLFRPPRCGVFETHDFTRMGVVFVLLVFGFFFVVFGWFVFVGGGGWGLFLFCFYFRGCFVVCFVVVCGFWVWGFWVWGC